MEIRRFTGAEASDDALRQCHELFVADTLRTFPGFPPQSFESFAAGLRHARYAGLGPRHTWAAWEGDRVFGFGTAVYPDDHLLEWVNVRVIVGEADRRRGIGTALLREIVADARAQGRVTLAGDQVRFGCPGEPWARAVGFANTQRNRWQMLHVTDVDRALWHAPVPEGFRLEQWSGAAPESLVAAFAAARNAIADAPTGESSYRESEWTVERVRATEAEISEAGQDLRFVVAVREATGDVAALTGMLLRPNRVDLCWQRDTAVVLGYRGLGLGRVIKAAMMRWLVADIPDLGKVVTNTAADNLAMIRVNERIGYTHYADIGVFEASVDELGAALGMSSNTNIPGPRREQELEGA